MFLKLQLIPFIKNKFEFGKEAAQIFCLERVTIAEWQGTSEDEKFVAELTWLNSNLFLMNGISKKVGIFMFRNDEYELHN